jgi:hypothetical protein
MEARPLDPTSLMMGVIRPVGVATATQMSARLYLSLASSHRAVERSETSETSEMREARDKSQAKEGLWRKDDEGSMERKGHLQNIAWSNTIRFQAITSDSRDTRAKKYEGTRLTS